MKSYRIFLPRTIATKQKGNFYGEKIRNFKTEPVGREIVTTGSSKITLPIPSSTIISDKKFKKEKSLRPNYFVAIPVVNEKIRQKLLDVQKSLVESNNKLKSALVSLQKTHITLAVVRLRDGEQINKASIGLKNAIAKMEMEGICDMKLNFHGLGHFRNEILFAKILEDDGYAKLQKIAEFVRDALIESGVVITDNRSFNAHLTVAKLSKDKRLRFLGLKKIGIESYKSFQAISFGEESCSKLQLLSMLKTDKATGYYHCVSELSFGTIA